MPFSVPIAGDLFGLNPQIAAGVPVPNVAGAFDQYFAGQDVARKQQLQGLFAGGLPRTPSGDIDWPQASEMILRAQGPEGLTGAIAAQKFGLLSDYFKKGGAGDVSIPGIPPAPTVTPRTSALPDQEQPVLPPSTARTAGSSTPRNLNLTSGDITGIERGPVTGALSFQPASFDERFTGDEGAIPSAARPRQYTEQLSAQAQQRPRIYIPGPGPDEAPTPQSPTGDVGAVPGAAQTSGGLTISEENARRYETAAAQLYQRSEALAALDPAMGAAARSRADSYSAVAKQIREALTKNFELTPEQKAARDAGLSQLEYARRQKAGELDVKAFQEEQDSIQRAAQNGAVGMQKAALGKQLTQQPGFYSGPWNEQFTTFQQFRSLFGQNPSSALPNEAFNKVTNDMLQEQIKSMGQSGVGRVLMSEVAVMQRALASLGITEVSNRALLEITQRTYRKAMEIAELTADLPPNSQQLKKVVLGYLKKNPVFTDAERANPALLGSKEPPPESNSWTRQQMLQWGAQNGLRPGDPIMFNGKLRQIPQLGQ